MAKKVVVTDKVKIRGIRRRWLINSVGVVLLVLALALGTFSTAMWSYYYSSTMNDLKRRAADDAGGFASFTRSQYWTNAQNAVQKFEDKTKLEPASGWWPPPLPSSTTGRRWQWCAM